MKWTKSRDTKMFWIMMGYNLYKKEKEGKIVRLSNPDCIYASKNEIDEYTKSRNKSNIYGGYGYREFYIPIGRYDKNNDTINRMFSKKEVIERFDKYPLKEMAYEEESNFNAYKHEGIIKYHECSLCKPYTEEQLYKMEKEFNAFVEKAQTHYFEDIEMCLKRDELKNVMYLLNRKSSQFGFEDKVAKPKRLCEELVR